MMKFNCDNQGFTLMEVMMVVMIISVMSSIILPSYSGFQATEQSFAEAAKLVADYRMARYRSIEHGCYTRLRFSALGDGWHVEELCDSGTGEPIDGEPTIPPADFLWDTVIGEDMREINPAVTMLFDPVTPPIIYFRPDGVSVSDASFNAAPVGVTKVTFYYADNDTAEGATVSLTPAGVVESKSYYHEEY